MKYKWYYTLCVLLGLYLNAYTQVSTFSNTSSTACSADFGSTYPSLLPKTVTVSGLPSGGLSSAGTVLRQINIKLGNTSCKGNLSTYSITLVSPGTKTITVANGLASTISSIWVDMHFRDNSALERLRDYTTTTQNSYYPHSIGYYRVETAGSFSVFNDGTDPNGTWTLHIIEGTSSEVTFESFSLVFGPEIVVNDVTGSSSNNDCSGATCIDLTGVWVGTNNGYSSPDANYPGSPVSGCGWNGANNNSAWFLFQASAATAYITLSGIANVSTTTTSDTQPIVVTANATCTAPTVVPTGGCPDDESINNSSYLTANGGGISTSGNVYVNGISDNCEFNLSGLTPGQNYYLYIDGNGGTASTFYIEGLTGLTSCIIVLPVQWLDVKAKCKNNGNEISWTVAQEVNNRLFEILKSSDGINYYKIGEVPGSGTSDATKSFIYKDDQMPFEGPAYYKIRQVDFNGKFTDSKVAYCNAEGSTGQVIVWPNPFTQQIRFAGLPELIGQIEVYDAIGRAYQPEIVYTGAGTGYIDFTNYNDGIYFLRINQSHNNSIKTIKLVKKE